MIGPNNAFEEELFFQFLKDPESLSPEWREYFEKVHGHSASLLDRHGREVQQAFKGKTDIHDDYKLQANETLEQLSPIPAKISQNMQDSVEVPTATSLRTMPVKALDENRRVINKYLLKMKRPKVSFTHILLWAIVRALVKYPHLNDAFLLKDGKPFRIKRKSVNAGLAVDIEKKDGSRLLLVPNVKNAQDYNFSEFINAFNEIIQKSRNNKLAIDDLVGTTVSLTNPGMIGTTASNPRLMKGQGMILAAGSIDYPVEFQAVRSEVLTTLAVSKVVTMTNTYDHRIIQGAESAQFLDYINKLLIGKYHFYDQIFAALKIPFEPVRWAVDQTHRTRRTLEIFDKEDMIEKGAHVMQMINSYRVRGHLLSSINPLGFESYYYPELDPAYYGFTIWDLDRIFHADDSWKNNNLPLRDIIELLRDTYCGTTGIEFMHIQAPEKKEWIKRKLEREGSKINFSEDHKIRIYKKLVEAEQFESFLHTKYVGHKRFSLEGSESLIVMIENIFENAAKDNLHAVVLGMAHRGRLNVLVNNIGKHIQDVFNEYDDEIDSTRYHGSGDVKYHLGEKGRFKSESGDEIDVILSPNPSHLELVNPVIEGMARALDNQAGDRGYTKALPVLVHGDAAFAGQGIVAETLNLSQLEGYKTGGTIHIIINNQIGFTTSVADARSSVYATDIAKMIQVPIIHVNGNDTEAVVAAAAFAYEYRAKFHSDVIIDVLSYRKYGHNEADEPTYTQPLLYKKIKSMPPVRNIFEQDLIADKILTGEKAKTIKKEYKDYLEKQFATRSERETGVNLTFKDHSPEEILREVDTSVSTEKIELITEKITRIPDRFEANPKVRQLMKKRAEMLASDQPAIDWAMAEALSFGSILLEGKEIRFSGEDSCRGTFSQRHAVLTDNRTEEQYVPLNNIQSGQALLRIFDSPLSELAILGFEYGYSVISKDDLTLWEAQFGDFTNMAQGVIDQFITCAEVKWGQTSNLVMLLPHSYDGQGPEHSSARLERFLQLYAEENIIVCNLSTPAQYFHALRRQVLMQFKKTLIIMSPKSMLRNPRAVSSISDLTENNFQAIIGDHAVDSNKVKRVLICSGKIYHELSAEREKRKKDDVAIIRVEQFCPFDEKRMKAILKSFSKAKHFFWVQEEPQNMGAYTFLYPRISNVLPGKHKLEYIGRPEKASTATGSFKKHSKEQKDILDAAISL